MSRPSGPVSFHQFDLAGLLGATVYMAVGYVVCNMIWPNFYFAHNETGKDVWLAGQLIGIAIYFYGIAVAFGRLRWPGEVELVK